MTTDGERIRHFLGLDLGGTNIKGGVVDSLGRRLSAVSRPTLASNGPEAGLATLVEVARQAVAESGQPWPAIEAIGLGAAGTLDTARGVIVDASNLPLWNGFPLGPSLAKQLDRPTVLVNDANAAAFGEYWAGAGRSSQSLVLFTLGTGIGCGIVESGRILEGRHGLGGECGHMTIQMDGGRLCTCGRSGHLEAYASVTALVARAVEALEVEPHSLLSEAQREGRLTGHEIHRCAQLGDALAVRLMKETARALAVGASVLMHTIDPDMVLFGGGMTAAGPGFLDLIREEIKAHAFPAALEGTKIDYASLGGDAGLIGAAGWASRAQLLN